MAPSSGKSPTVTTPATYIDAGADARVLSEGGDQADDIALPSWARDLVADAAGAGEDVEAGLAMAREYGTRLPLPGAGATALRWRLLADVAARDLTAGRILEAHADGLAILDEAGENQPDGTWGVFAAQSPGVGLDAVFDEAAFELQGTSPWCSLAGELDHALVVAQVGKNSRLFAVDLHHPSVRTEPPSIWVARGLRNVPSAPVHFDRTPARPVGEAGWYLARSGFAWGGMGVAACWYGGARALASRLVTEARHRGGELAAFQVGSVDVALYSAGAALADAARRIDAGQADGDCGALLALRVRSVVAATVEHTITQVGHFLGPAPLAFDEEHARRVADLGLYVRQHHAERDLAALGRALVDADRP